MRRVAAAVRIGIIRFIGYSCALIAVIAVIENTMEGVRTASCPDERPPLSCGLVHENRNHTARLEGKQEVDGLAMALDIGEPS